MGKTYTHDKAADFFSRLEAREDAVTEALAAVQLEYEKASTEIGKTFKQIGQWYQMRKRGGKWYMVELPSAPAEFLRTKKPNPADIAEIEDLAPDAGKQVELDLVVGEDLVGFDDDGEVEVLEDNDFEAPVFHEPTRVNPEFRVIGE